jgi:hypothetical protein
MQSEDEGGRESITASEVGGQRSEVRGEVRGEVGGGRVAEGGAASQFVVPEMRIPSSFHDLNRRISARLVVARVCALVFTLSCAGASRDVLPLYRAEDARAATSADLEILLRALRSPDAETRVIALRATGRLQRSDLLDSLVPALGDSAEAVRIEAANAVAQIVQPGRDTAAAESPSAGTRESRRSDR